MLVVQSGTTCPGSSAAQNGPGPHMSINQDRSQHTSQWTHLTWAISPLRFSSQVIVGYPKLLKLRRTGECCVNIPETLVDNNALRLNTYSDLIAFHCLLIATMEKIIKICMIASTLTPLLYCFLCKSHEDFSEFHSRLLWWHTCIITALRRPIQEKL